MPSLFIYLFIGWCNKKKTKRDGWVLGQGQALNMDHNVGWHTWVSL